MKYLILMLLAACPAKKSADAPKDPAPADAGTTDPVAAPLDAAPVVTPGNPFCANRPEKAGPFVLDATLAAQRRGTGAKTYADVDSSKAQPIEVCGMEGARIWLEKTRCPDGSVGVQGGRFDSVGRGGRCDTMIERFKVGCPDGTLNIVFAVHFCGPGEVM
jgi:hypothetical protein